MPRCGSQCILCDVPVRFDTYVGCSHACSYCFVNRKKDISKIELNESPQQLRDFINGKRTLETKWCDWNIPLHNGGNVRSVSTLRKDTQKNAGMFEDFSRNKIPVHNLNKKHTSSNKRIS